MRVCVAAWYMSAGALNVVIIYTCGIKNSYHRSVFIHCSQFYNNTANYGRPLILLKPHVVLVRVACGSNIRVASLRMYLEPCSMQRLSVASRSIFVTHSGDYRCSNPNMKTDEQRRFIKKVNCDCKAMQFLGKKGVLPNLTTAKQ